MEQVDFIRLNVSELHLEIRLNVFCRNTFVKSQIRKKKLRKKHTRGFYCHRIFYCNMFRLGANVTNVYVSGEK